MIIVYIGDVYEYLAKLACAADPAASIITAKNINNLTAGTYYTSLAELGGLDNLGIVLRTADKIVYAPPDEKWSDSFFGNSKMKIWTEDYLKIFQWRIPIENFTEISNPENKKNMLALADVRKSKSTQLWSVGCSITHGIGVQPAQRYGQLLANELELPVSFLTRSGSSIIWAADQILRSDIQPGDIIVWGLTSTPRLPYFNNTLRHLHARIFIEEPALVDKLSIDVLDHDDTLYRSVIGVKQVINFCEKINAKLIIASVLDNILIEYIKDFINLIMLYNLWGRDPNRLFNDIGNDNMHPGVNTHKFYAYEILKKIKENNT